MARKTKDEARETREKILNASIDVFYDHGVSKSSLELIAEAAGVTRGAVYWHFENKRAIFSALHERFHVSIMDGLTGRENSDTPLNDLREFSLNVLELIQTDRQHRKVFSVFTLKCDYSGEMAPFLDEQRVKKADSLSNVTKLFESAKAKGQIAPDEDAGLLAVSFFCYMCGICVEYLRNPSMVHLEKNAKPLVAQFFHKL